MAEPEIKNDSLYDVKLTRPVMWGGGRPLRPDQTHQFTGAVITAMRADSRNDGALEVIREVVAQV